MGLIELLGHIGIIRPIRLIKLIRPIELPRLIRLIKLIRFGSDVLPSTLPQLAPESSAKKQKKQWILQKVWF